MMKVNGSHVSMLGRLLDELTPLRPHGDPTV